MGDEVVKRRRILIIVVVQVASAIRPAGALVAGLAYRGSYGGVGPSGPTCDDDDYGYDLLLAGRKVRWHRHT